MFHTKFVKKIKTHFVFNNFSRKLCRLQNNMKKYGRAGEATYNNIIWRMRIECWITNAKNTGKGAHAHTQNM